MRGWKTWLEAMLWGSDRPMYRLLRNTGPFSCANIQNQIQWLGCPELLYSYIFVSKKIYGFCKPQIVVHHPSPTIKLATTINLYLYAIEPTSFMLIISFGFIIIFERRPRFEYPFQTACLNIIHWNLAKKEEFWQMDLCLSSYYQLR